MFKLQNAIQIIGAELRTTNDNGRSFQEIPPFWENFMKNNSLGHIPNKLNEDVYVVYTHFENEGKNNQGLYSMIIGSAVTQNTIPPDKFTTVMIPSGDYRVFPVEKNRSDKVGDAWLEIWEIPASEKQNWSFVCEFECYKKTGEIDIFIGLK